MEDRAIYKRVKINWWIILLFVGINVWMIFAYIHQWGNNPIDKTGLLFISTAIWVMFFVCTPRFKMIIDDKSVILFKVNWWLILIIVGLYVFVIFSYINQSGSSRSISMTGFVIMTIIWIFVLFLGGRFKVIIGRYNSNFSHRGPDFWSPIKIPIVNVTNVSIKQIGLIKISGKCIDNYIIDFVKQNVCIQMKNRNVYQIAIKDADRIKEEIEKRINKISNHEIRRDQSLI